MKYNKCILVKLYIVVAIYQYYSFNVYRDMRINKLIEITCSIKLSSFIYTIGEIIFLMSTKQNARLN